MASGQAGTPPFPFASVQAQPDVQGGLLEGHVALRTAVPPEKCSPIVASGYCGVKARRSVAEEVPDPLQELLGELLEELVADEKGLRVRVRVKDSRRRELILDLIQLAEGCSRAALPFELGDVVASRRGNLEMQ